MGNPRVLHADDVERWQLIVSSALADQCKVESVNSCDDVMPRLANGGIDLVVLDLLMGGNSPDANGYEVLQDIRSTYPDLPVVMFTGGTSGTDIKADELSAKWNVPVIYKSDDEGGEVELSEKVAELLG